MGPRTHAAWLGSSVFDGARAFEGVTPDLALHCAPVNESAAHFHLKPLVPVDGWLELVADGLKRFDRNAELYIRPMYWAETGAPGGVRHDPDSTRWCLCVYEAPLPKPAGSAITLSPFRRPTADCAPVGAKAGCLYPNNARALIEARERGFDNCLLRDMLGHVAELGTANVFMARDGVVCDAGPQRHVPQRHHAPARDRAAARRRRARSIEKTPHLCGLPGRRRDLLVRQLFQALARDPHRRPRAAARPVLPQGARALLGLRAQLSGRPYTPNKAVSVSARSPRRGRAGPR